MHQITFKKQAIKALHAMPPREVKRIRDQLSKLAEDPGRRDVDVVELKDRPGFRLRVGGRRVIFERDDTARRIDVLRIGPRGDVYGD
jgi:mRNA interferase RelE/StbE